ncbi:hypothetical protein EIP86_011450 [Pleurotus ostreatoroseus]|nr:hypothetical protein EIP86_011450 [Pleurotus ostreatoroseus]
MNSTVSWVLLVCPLFPIEILCRTWTVSFRNVQGVPHRVMEDDVYRGMLISKGSTIIVNARALTMDPGVYNEPREFRPERFLPGNGEPHPVGASSGYGRRICVGRHLADANIWLAAASILAMFDIAKVKDELGLEITPQVEMVEAIVSHPAPFKCEFRPRRKQVQQLMEEQ